MLPSKFSRWLRSGKTGHLLAALLFSTLAGCGGGGGGFDISPFWVETDVASADIDRDGQTDVATVAALFRGVGDREGRLTIYRQGASGAFTVDSYVVGRYPWRVEVHDIDGDEKDDVLVLDVIGEGFNNNVLYLLLQDGANPGHFLPPRAIASGLTTYDFTVNDLNGDGAPDIVIAGGPGGGNGAQLLMQNAVQRGTFQPLTTLALPGRAQQVHSGDLNGDGLVDLAFYATTSFNVNTGSSGHIVIVYAEPGGGFAAPIAFAPEIGLNAELLRIADVQGDGLPDLVVIFNPFSSDYRGKVRVLLQTSLGIFNATDSFPSLRGTDGFVVSDLNSDNRPEVATTGFFPDGSGGIRSTTNVLVHIGGGTYGLAAVYEMPVSMSRINAADVDGDGFNDLLLLGGSGRTLISIQAGILAGADERGKAYGLLSLAGGVGSMLGGLITGPLADRW
ncbi:MAG: VCBS repeat-containing protein [Betaproteobacteria bacterium]|nr:MAG: VCBS repeat-containing protein [Betaproteobacteria bacterium]